MRLVQPLTGFSSWTEILTSIYNSMSLGEMSFKILEVKGPITAERQ